MQCRRVDPGGRQVEEELAFLSDADDRWGEPPRVQPRQQVVTWRSAPPTRRSGTTKSTRISRPSTGLPCGAARSIPCALGSAAVEDTSTRFSRHAARPFAENSGVGRRRELVAIGPADGDSDEQEYDADRELEKPVVDGQPRADEDVIAIIATTVRGLPHRSLSGRVRYASHSRWAASAGTQIHRQSDHAEFGRDRQFVLV